MSLQACLVSVPPQSQCPDSQLLASAMANAGQLGALADSQFLEGNDAPTVQGLKVCGARQDQCGCYTSLHVSPWLVQYGVESLLGHKSCLTQAVSGLGTLPAIVQEDHMQSEPDPPSNLGSKGEPHDVYSLPGMSDPQGTKVNANVSCCCPW